MTDTSTAGEAGRMEGRGRGWWSPSVSAVVLVAAVVVPRWLSWPVERISPLGVVTALPLPVVGVLLTARRRGGPVGWLLLAGGIGQWLSGALFPDVHRVAPRDAVAQWLGLVSNTMYNLSFVVLAAVVPFFPDGRLPGRRWRVLIVAAVAAAVEIVVLLPVPWRDVVVLHPLVNPIGVQALLSLSIWFPLVFVLLAVVVVGGIGALIVRWRRGNAEERVQVAWLLLAVGLCATLSTAAAVVQALAPTYRLWLDNLAVLPWTVLVPVSILVAVSRYRLYGFDIVVSRSLTYTALIVTLAAVYGGTVALGGKLLSGGLPSVTGAVVVALSLAPLRDRLQRAANRLVYGRRDEPYQALADLAQRLEKQIPPDEVVDAVVDGVATALRLPYVALVVPRRRQPDLVAARGEILGDVYHVDLVHRDDIVGRLTVSPRPGQRLHGREQRLLHDLARHSASVIAASRLTAELVESRDRLAAVQEHERGRIWSELHDGLGPLLTGVSFGLEAARNQLRSHGPDDQLLDDLGTQVRAGIADVRRMVHELRPLALNEHGLAVAIDQQAASLAKAAGFHAHVEATGPLRGLQPAVELAAYRIATEALTNAARHARPRYVSVRICATPHELAIEIADDGVGISDFHESGGGLTTMRQRAIDLGGTCTIKSHPQGGTVVATTLPRNGHDH